MNRRRREILTALAPAYDFAMKRAYGAAGPEGIQHYQQKAREVPGLALRARAEASADAPAELTIYGRIGGGGWFSEGISAADVNALLKEAGPGPLNVRINSGGGDVFDGVAIHTLLARHPGVVTCYVDGLAASAASFIMLAGDHIVSARNAFIMIHDAMTFTYGNGNTHRDAGELLDKVSVNIADMYTERAGEDVEHWRNLMTVNGEDGSWFTGQEALAAGLVDELTSSKEDPEEDGEVANRLKGWEALLPSKAQPILNLARKVQDSAPEPEPFAWDHNALISNMKGFFA